MQNSGYLRGKHYGKAEGGALGTAISICGVFDFVCVRRTLSRPSMSTRVCCVLSVDSASSALDMRRPIAVRAGCVLICKSCARLLRLTPSVARATRAAGSRVQGRARFGTSWPEASFAMRHVPATARCRVQCDTYLIKFIFFALTSVTAIAKFSFFCDGFHILRQGARAGWEPHRRLAGSTRCW